MSQLRSGMVSSAEATLNGAAVIAGSKVRKVRSIPVPETTGGATGAAPQTRSLQVA
ncbi:hypothetical protein D3C72_2500820 [compost metagenome]